MLKDSSEAREKAHLQAYEEEVREFLASRGMESGKPSALGPFAARLAEAGPFEEEMGSILRSIVYRESEQLGRGELLDLVTRAVGGPVLDSVAPGMQANVRTIFLSLGKALRQQRSSFVPPQVERNRALPPEPSPEERQAALAPDASAALPAVSPGSERLTASLPGKAAKEDQPAVPASAPSLRWSPSTSLASGEAHFAKPAPAPDPAPDPAPGPIPDPASSHQPPGSAPAAAARGGVSSGPASGSFPAVAAGSVSASPHPFSPWIAADTAGVAVPPASSRAPEAARPADISQSSQEGALYRALHLSSGPALGDREEYEDFDEDEEDMELAQGLRRPFTRWLVPAVAGVLILLGLAFYFGRSGRGSGQAALTTASSDVTATASPVTTGNTCTPPSATTYSRSGLDERSRWAHNLLDQKLYEVALPELREIARMDPSYPGIRLDESDALLNLKRPDEARAAIDEQISLSQCLAKLSPSALRSYCSLHFPATTLGGCQAQMAHIRQQAELQAALVHLELGHRVEPGAEAADFTGLGHTTRKRATPRRQNAPAPSADVP